MVDLDPNHDGQITEDEFNLIFKYITQRQQTSFPPIDMGNRDKFNPDQSVSQQQKS